MKREQLTRTTQVSRRRTKVHYNPSHPKAQPYPVDPEVVLTGIRDLFELIHTSLMVTTTDAADTRAMLDFEAGYRHLLNEGADMSEADWNRQFEAVVAQGASVAKRVESGDIAFLGRLA